MHHVGAYVPLGTIAQLKVVEESASSASLLPFGSLKPGYTLMGILAILCKSVTLRIWPSSCQAVALAQAPVLRGLWRVGRLGVVTVLGFLGISIHGQGPAREYAFCKLIGHYFTKKSRAGQRQ